jgi:hypothetical protein
VSCYVERRKPPDVFPDGLNCILNFCDYSVVVVGGERLPSSSINSVLASPASSHITDLTRVTNRRIPAVDLVSRLEMILRGKVSNISAHVAYSAWNLPPSKTFISFVSNPLAGDSGLGLRVRPSPEEVEASVVSLGEIPNDERKVHFEMPINPSDAEISAMLDMLAEDSSDLVPAETLVVAPIPEPGNTLDIQRSDSTRPKRPRQASHPTSPVEGKKKKKRQLR